MSAWQQRAHCRGRAAALFALKTAGCRQANLHESKPRNPFLARCKLVVDVQQGCLTPPRHARRLAVTWYRGVGTRTPRRPRARLSSAIGYPRELGSGESSTPAHISYMSPRVSPHRLSRTIDHTQAQPPEHAFRARPYYSLRPDQPRQRCPPFSVARPCWEADPARRGRPHPPASYPHRSPLPVQVHVPFAGLCSSWAVPWGMFRFVGAR